MHHHGAGGSRRRIATRVLTVVGLLGLSVPAVAAESVDAFRSKMEKWVETRQLISAEQSDWREEQQTLRAERDLLKAQRTALRESVKALEATDTAADEERRQLLLERGERQRASRALEDKIRAYEEEVLAIVPQLPAPLQEKLKPLLVQIPEDPLTTKLQLGQRLMNVLGVLAQAEKWNGTATFVAETRSVGDGPKMQVRTLYWGLGQAIYVDAKGRTAGIGRPGPDGWVFEDDPALASQAQLLLDIYEGNVDVIDFVGLPVRIQ